MSTTFPTSLDSFTNPGPNDAMNASPALDHDVQHDNENDAITALETKVGVDGSSDPGSLDYKSKNGSFIRTMAAVTTYSLSPGATDPTETLAIGKGCLLIQLQTDYPAWVRIYSSLAAQTNDNARPRTVDPVAGTGVLLEVITTAGAGLVVPLSPAVIASSLEAVPADILYITVTNDDVTIRAITTTVTLIPVEG